MKMTNTTKDLHSWLLVVALATFYKCNTTVFICTAVSARILSDLLYEDNFNDRHYNSKYYILVIS